MRLFRLKSAAKHGSMQEQAALAYAKLGIILALLSGIVFSLNSMLVNFSKSFSPFDRAELFLLIPFMCVFLNDFSAGVITTCVNIKRGHFKDIGRSLASRPGRYIILGASIGAVCGMGGYMTALHLAGPAYVLPITSLYPAVAAVLAVFTIKERITPRAWGGLAMCVCGAIIIGYVTPEGDNGKLFYLGLAFAVLAAFGWGAEGVCATSGMDFIDPLVALNIYYLISSCIYLFLILPLVSLLILPDAGGIAVLGEFISSSGTRCMLLAGLISTISYQCWYRSMNMTGVSRSMALNITYALWGIIFASIFTTVEITNNLIIGACVILVGMFLVIGNPHDMLNLRKTD